jgi:hypothetical protein
MHYEMFYFIFSLDQILKKNKSEQEKNNTMNRRINKYIST